MEHVIFHIKTHVHSFLVQPDQSTNMELTMLALSMLISCLLLISGTTANSDTPKESSAAPNGFPPVSAEIEALKAKFPPPIKAKSKPVKPAPLADAIPDDRDEYEAVDNNNVATKTPGVVNANPPPPQQAAAEEPDREVQTAEVAALKKQVPPPQKAIRSKLSPSLSPLADAVGDDYDYEANKPAAAGGRAIPQQQRAATEEPDMRRPPARNVVAYISDVRHVNF